MKQAPKEGKLGTTHFATSSLQCPQLIDRKAMVNHHAELSSWVAQQSKCTQCELYDFNTTTLMQNSLTSV